MYNLSFLTFSSQLWLNNLHLRYDTFHWVYTLGMIIIAIFEKYLNYYPFPKLPSVTKLQLQGFGFLLFLQIPYIIYKRRKIGLERNLEIIRKKFKELLEEDSRCYGENNYRSLTRRAFYWIKNNSEYGKVKDE